MEIQFRKTIPGEPNAKGITLGEFLSRSYFRKSDFPKRTIAVSDSQRGSSEVPNWNSMLRAELDAYFIQASILTLQVIFLQQRSVPAAAAPDVCRLEIKESPQSQSRSQRRTGNHVIEKVF